MKPPEKSSFFQLLQRIFKPKEIQVIEKDPEEKYPPISRGDSTTCVDVKHTFKQQEPK
jgi:hypothetical protein